MSYDRGEKSGTPLSPLLLSRLYALLPPSLFCLPSPSLCLLVRPLPLLVLLQSLRADRQRLAAVELNLEHQRRLNDALQTEAVAASDNLDAALRRVRELEDRLQGATAQAADLTAKLKEMEVSGD